MRIESEVLSRITNIFELVKKKKPIVHCITNYVTVNDCANSILSINASPIMADFKEEVEEVTSFSNSLLINIGTISNHQFESMLLAGKIAKLKKIPIIFDPVGAGATKYRNKVCHIILDTIKPDIIRGNYSELKSIINDNFINNNMTRGVDVSLEDTISESNLNIVTNELQKLSYKFDSVIISTGKIDVICYKEIVYYCYNGNEKLCKITGSGCMLSSIIAGFSGVFSNQNINNKQSLLEASLLGVVLMGISGEKAVLDYENNKISNGYGLLHYKLIDYISLINREIIINEGKLYSNK